MKSTYIKYLIRKQINFDDLRKKSYSKMLFEKSLDERKILMWDLLLNMHKAS
jgi:hypothetical protein